MKYYTQSPDALNEELETIKEELAKKSPTMSKVVRSALQTQKTKIEKELFKARGKTSTLRDGTIVRSGSIIFVVSTSFVDSRNGSYSKRAGGIEEIPILAISPDGKKIAIARSSYNNSLVYHLVGAYGVASDWFGTRDKAETYLLLKACSSLRNAKKELLDAFKDFCGYQDMLRDLVEIFGEPSPINTETHPHFHEELAELRKPLTLS